MERGVEWATARLVVVAGTGIYRQPGQRTAGSEPVVHSLGNLKTPRTITGLEQLFIRAPVWRGRPSEMLCISSDGFQRRAFRRWMGRLGVNGLIWVVCR